MRMRCEKRKQKDATQQQAELTEDQIAERRAKADAFAQVPSADAQICISISHQLAAGCMQEIAIDTYIIVTCAHCR